MPVFDVTAPDGKVYEVAAPEGATKEQAMAKAMEFATPKGTILTANTIPAEKPNTPDLKTQIFDRWIKAENTPTAKKIKGDKGLTHWGINSHANDMTDEEITNLTEEGARDILDREYWNRAKIDTLPENLQEMAFNFAGVAGVSSAKKAIAASKGDKEMLRNAIFRHFDAVIKAKPEKAINRKGWINRFSLY